MTPTLLALALTLAAHPMSAALIVRQPPFAVVQPFRAASASTSQDKKIDEFKMMTYQAVIVKKGERWNDSSSKADALRTEHHAYLNEMMRAGRLVIAGSFTGDNDLRGAYIIDGTREQALAIAQADPGVKAGRWAVDVLPWMGPEGWFQKPADVMERETLYFGFLVSGPNRSQDAETAKALQRQHLDYMDGQAKLGRLLMAGPLLAGDQPRRGIVTYRASTHEEARAWASDDPMVKAGRLAVELYGWSVPKGILE